jgi:hypothetical protein
LQGEGLTEALFVVGNCGKIAAIRVFTEDEGIATES